MEQTAPDFDFQMIKINGKKLNTTLFNQLFQQQPFNDNYELQHEIKGRVYKTKNFVIFSTTEGARKFETTYFLRKEKENSLVESVYSCLHERLSPAMELEKVRFDVKRYYESVVDEEREEPTYISSCIDSLLDGTAAHYDREVYQETLLRLLKGDFKSKLEIAYEQGLQKKKNLNKLVEIFSNAPQIFL